MAGLQRDLARVVALALIALLQLALLRAELLVSQWSSLSSLAASDLVTVLYAGSRLDGVVVGYLLLPACLALLARLPVFLNAYARVVLGLLSAACVFELTFFEYYGFRPNYLVLEHGTDAEVLLTALRGYASPGALLAAGLLAAASLVAHHRVARALARIPALQLDRPRQVGTAVVVLLASGLMARGTLDHRPLNPSLASVTPNRVANEVAGSGLLNVANQAIHWGRRSEMQLAAHHALLPEAEADARVRRLLGQQGRFTGDSANPFVRHIAQPDAPGRPLNVVLVVMESFTGRLVGALGGEPALSPELDALAREGLLLTRCYATGERTVQGLEALVSSFPPLPGVSVVRRPEARRDFSSLGSVFAARGYDTLFLYGGQGIFDHMRAFFVGNGFKSFIEERDFQQVSYRSSWGVSDEDLFRRANREFQERWERGVPFFATLLTVSLHAPWEFPPGRAPMLPPGTTVPPGFESDELANFLYADFAVGEFVREARKLPYFADTLFVFVADHGVHLRGRELLPSEEYLVPALFLAPGRVEPQRIDRVSSQLDVAPTILGIAGSDYRSTFFGRNVLDDREEDGLAILIYNKRRYGVRRADRLTVLQEGGGRAAYDVSRSGPQPAPLSDAHGEDARDGLAMVQVAEGLLRSRRYTTAGAGRTSTKLQPVGAPPETRTSPPWARAIARAIGRPRPTPVPERDPE